MKDAVIDASALVLAVADKTSVGSRFRARLPTIRVHAPHLVDAEVGNVVRRHELADLLSPGEGVTALTAAHALVRHRYPHHGTLADLAWGLRGNLSFYDGLYVALAATLRIPLITRDARLSKAPGLPCDVELV
ncbi:MAG TPA: type II toxin-antitoxin system VapC family toxin [Segeticoccus sp.]|nr:type II toxin-antitoxin system VapC family toxin [Segeticoccus sp.]